MLLQDDIKEADIKIKESYKMYWKLKTRALEETLVDISFSDETEDNVTQNVMCTLSEEIKDDNKSLRDNEKHEQDENSTKNIEDNIESNEKNTSLKDIKSMENRDNENINVNKSSQECQSQHSINSLADENECKNVKGVWGDHLSKNNEQIPKKKQTSVVGRSSSFQLSQNKFTSSSFMKRNPRKSLSTTKTKNKSEKDDNIGTSTSAQSTNIELNNKDDLNVDEETKSILDTKSVKVTYVEPKYVAQSIGTIQQLTEGHIISRNLNPGWLDRCAKQNNLDCTSLDLLQRLSGKSDSGIESIETSIRSSKENILASDMQEISQISDEEDFICNSDSEGEHKNKRIRNFKKGFNDQENHPSKKICLENCTDSLVSSKTVLSEEKCNDLNITSINSAKTNSIHVNIQKNLINNVDKCNDNVKDILQAVNTNTHDQEDIEKSVKQKSTNRKIRRKIKHDSSDDSDPDFDESEEKKKKKKVSKTRRTSTRRKSKANESTTTNEIKSATKTKRSCRKKKNVQDEEDVLETCDADLENTNDKKPEIYGIETLEAVPRFAICKSNQGDLIEQFARSISSKADDLSFTEPAKSRKQLTNKETLEKKIADGKVNENFVRINLKKKVFVRGKKHFNFSKYKKNQWKERKKELASGEGSLMVADFVEKKGAYSCFKCGSTGHFSKYCPNKNSDDLIPLNEVDESSTYPTLEEAQQMASQNAIKAHVNRIDRLPEKPSYFVEAKLESTKNETGNKTDDHDLWEPIEDEVCLKFLIFLQFCGN